MNLPILIPIQLDLLIINYKHKILFNNCLNHIKDLDKQRILLEFGINPYLFSDIQFDEVRSWIKRPEFIDLLNRSEFDFINSGFNGKRGLNYGKNICPNMQFLWNKCIDKYGIFNILEFLEKQPYLYINDKLQSEKYKEILIEYDHPINTNILNPIWMLVLYDLSVIKDCSFNIIGDFINTNIMTFNLDMDSDAIYDLKFNQDIEFFINNNKIDINHFTLTKPLYNQRIRPFNTFSIKYKQLPIKLKAKEIYYISNIRKKLFDEFFFYI